MARGGILPGGTERWMERDDEEKRYLVFVAVAVDDKDREATQIVPGNKITHSQLEEKNQLLRVSKTSQWQETIERQKEPTIRGGNILLRLPIFAQ